MKIQTALGQQQYASCAAWLSNPSRGNWSTWLSGLLGPPELFGHSLIYRSEIKPDLQDYTVAAAVGGLAPPGYLLVVNRVGKFFVDSTPDGSALNNLGGKNYQGGTPKAKAAILIHELAHLIEAPGFQSDGPHTQKDKKDKPGKENDDLVDKQCRQLIEGIK